MLQWRLNWIEAINGLIVALDGAHFLVPGLNYYVNFSVNAKF